ncbi:MAG: hypothetical protein ABI703_09270 [Gemmatimonadales bacterium]
MGAASHQQYIPQPLSDIPERLAAALRDRYVLEREIGAGGMVTVYLALAARPETWGEGLRWLRYGFESLPLYKPVTFLALGHTYEAASQCDSAAAYRRFLRLWDKADP